MPGKFGVVFMASFSFQAGYIGGEITAVTLARVIIGAVVNNRSARVLPRLAFVVPMKAKLGQCRSDGNGLLAVKLNPNPFADDFGGGKEIRGFAAKQSQQLFSVQGTIRKTAFQIDFWLCCQCQIVRDGSEPLSF